MLLKSMVGASIALDEVPPSLSSLVDSLATQRGQWKQMITARISQVGAKFTAALSKQEVENNQLVAGDRFNLAAAFYYKALESIIEHEIKARPANKGLMGLLHNDLFNVALLACSIEITMYTYQADTLTLAFPWVLEAIGLCPYEFQKVVEILIRSESGLSSAIIKHLSKCETAILQSLVWSKQTSLHPFLAKAKAAVAVVGVGGAADGGATAAADGGRPATPILEAVAGGFFDSLSKVPAFKSLHIFFRKVFHLAKLRLEDLCGKLRVPKEISVLMSACLRHAIEAKHSTLLVGRHIDQLLMSSIHAVWIVAGGGTTPLPFSKIIASYRSQPQADPRVCYEIPLAEDPATKGDIIAFYNGFFVPVMEPFIRQLGVGAAAAAASAGAYDLRASAALPLPELKSNRLHSPRRVGRSSSVTVSPISESRMSASQALPQGSPKKSISYAFHHSPSKNLDEINLHVANQSPQKKGAVRSRGDEEDDSNLVKRPKVMKPPTTEAAGSKGGDNQFLSIAKASSSTMHGSPLKASYSVAASPGFGAAGTPRTGIRLNIGIAGGPAAPRPPAAVVSSVPISPEMGVAPLAGSPQKPTTTID
jgi:hypothetical protein